MSSAGFSPPERLIFDVQGLIAELKKEFFTRNVPLNDDDTLVHKLCVRLENVLHYGAREKYTFMGTRKDYWNYISDSLPKDETVMFVQSISEIKTYHGKGRTFLRQALKEKSLADTLQRCAINERMTREYYMTDSVFRNQQSMQTLVHSLYDLNAVDFQLPHQGYDLDRSFPSFARKPFGEQRRNSGTSIVSEQEVLSDPVHLLNRNVDELEKNIDKWLGKNDINESVDAHVPTLQKVIDKINFINVDVIKLKSRNENEIENLQINLSNLKEEKIKSDADMDLRMKQLHEHYLSMQKLDTSSASDKLKELYDKLTVTELELAGFKTECSLLDQDPSRTKRNLQSSQEECEKLKLQNKKYSENLEELRNKLANHKHLEHSYESTNKILENKLSELQKINDSMKSKEKELNQKLVDSESNVKIKENELLALKDAFEKSSGLVVGSFKELKEELNNQLKEKTEVLHNVSTANEELVCESKSLLQAKSELEQTRRTLERKIYEERRKREEAEKIVSELKLKVTEEMKHQAQFEKFVSDVWMTLHGYDETDETDETDSIDDADGLLKKKHKKHKHLPNHDDDAHGLPKTSPQDEREAVLKKLMELQEELLQLKNEKQSSEEEAIGLKYELSSLTKNFKELQEKSKGDEEEFTTVKNELEKTLQEKEDILNELSERDKNIKEIEGRQCQECTNWIVEKDKYLNDNNNLNVQYASITAKYAVAEKEITFLKVEVAKLAKEKEEEKGTRINAWNRLNNLIEGKKNDEQKHLAEIKLLKEDLDELKSHLVNMTKDKHELWRKKDTLEWDLKQKADERWVSDDEVTKCTNCLEIFTLTLRKHHCRLCGHIFCINCSNRWLKTPHGRRRVRACDVCADAYNEMHGKSEVDAVDGNQSDISSLSDRTMSVGDDSYDATDNKDLPDTTDGPTVHSTSDDELATDPFEILDPADVSSSGSFGSSEQIHILEADVKKDPLVPTIHDESEEEVAVSKEKVEFPLPSGQRYLMPVVVDSNKFELMWEFNSSPKDIGFGIAFKENEEEADSEIQTIIPLSRYISHKQKIHGRMKIEKPGVYYLIFNNSYSRLTTKNVVCYIALTRRK